MAKQGFRSSAWLARDDEGLEEALRERVYQLVAARSGARAEDIQAHHQFVTDLDYDSLDTVEMTIALEEEFGIELDDSQCSACSTVQACVEMVEERVRIARQEEDDLDGCRRADNISWSAS